MVRQKPYEVIAGSTIKLTWVNSGVTPSSISSALRDRNEALVSSITASNSGNGLYYAVMLHPNSYANQYLVNEWIAVINANTYVSRQFGRVVTLEVD